MVTPQFDRDDKFRAGLRPCAERIYREHLGATLVRQPKVEAGEVVSWLDKNFAVDQLVFLKDGESWLSVQEKYRRGNVWGSTRCRVDSRYPDFTQEYKNGAGTTLESSGEWFKLGAHLYFYAWANEAETDFVAWVVLDVRTYKQLVNDAGGLARIGKIQKNKAHGSASFYAIPIVDLRRAWLAASANLVSFAIDYWERGARHLAHH